MSLTRDMQRLGRVLRGGDDRKPGGLRKIADEYVPRPCLNPEHDPPSMIVLEPGTYEYTCPGCGETVTFSVPSVTC